MGIASSTISILSHFRGGAKAVREPPKGSFLVGNVSVALRALVQRSGTAFRRANDAFRLSDLLVILFISFVPQKIFEFSFNRYQRKMNPDKEPEDFEDVTFGLVCGLLSQLGQLGLLVYFGELLIIFMSSLGFPWIRGKSRLFGSFVYSFWASRQLSNLSHYLLNAAINKYPNRRKLAAHEVLYSRVLDFFIYLIAAVLFCDANGIDIGVALASLLTLGGVSSVVIGLALKDPVTEIIQGTSLLLSDKFRMGDVIRLGDGTAGNVLNLGWTDTQIRGVDDSFVRIPHTTLAKTRVTNLSRTHRSQVRQEIRIGKQYTDKVDEIVNDIKDEIRASCPKLITDGTMPFRVHWTDFEKDNIVISVDACFRIQRLSDEYWDNRQNVLKAIARAVKKNE